MVLINIIVFAVIQSVEQTGRITVLRCEEAMLLYSEQLLSMTTDHSKENQVYAAMEHVVLDEIFDSVGRLVGA